MRNRILALIASEAVFVVAGLWLLGRSTSWAGLPSPLLLVGFTVALTVLALAPRVYIEHHRHACWITPSDGALLVGLFVLGPVGFLVSGVVAELFIALRLRQAGVKTAFNLVSMFGGLVVAATVFAMLGRADPSDPLAWLCGAAALAACTVWDILSTSAVFSIVENQRFSVLIRRVGPPLLLSFALSAVLGIIALVLFNDTPLATLLLVPILGILVMSTRAVSHQRTERDRLQRLHEASSNLARLVGVPEMLGLIATEARTLLTGASAICCTIAPDGSRTGVLVDDEGPREASPEVLASLVAIVSDQEQGERSAGPLPRRQRQLLPPFASVVWAAKEAEPAGRVLLLVFRDLPASDQDSHRSDILAAFVSHAATAVANVELHQDVEDALERQLELNRQKSEFVAAVSHELRTPLTSIIGSVQTVKRLGERLGPEGRLEMLDLGLSQGARLRDLIEDLLLVAAVDHKEIHCAREPIVVADLIGSLATELAMTSGDRLRAHVGETAGMITSDSDKVRRILINLVDNARKYAPDGPIDIDARRVGDRLVISVSDRGPGIPASERERVFERFVQLDQSLRRRQGGTGLGLHLCRQLAGLLGGTLVAGEAPSGGAKMVLDLPVEPAEPRAAGEPDVGSELPDGVTRSPLRSTLSAAHLTSVGRGAPPADPRQLEGVTR